MEYDSKLRPLRDASGSFESALESAPGLAPAVALRSPTNLGSPRPPSHPSLPSLGTHDSHDSPSPPRTALGTPGRSGLLQEGRPRGEGGEGRGEIEQQWQGHVRHRDIEWLQSMFRGGMDTGPSLLGNGGAKVSPSLHSGTREASGGKFGGASLWPVDATLEPMTTAPPATSPPPVPPRSARGTSLDKVLQALSPRYDAAVASWVPRRGVQGEGIRRRAKERSRQSASEVGAVSTARGAPARKPPHGYPPPSMSSWTVQRSEFPTRRLRHRG